MDPTAFPTVKRFSHRPSWNSSIPRIGRRPAISFASWVVYLSSEFCCIPRSVFGRHNSQTRWCLYLVFRKSLTGGNRENRVRLLSPFSLFPPVRLKLIHYPELNFLALPWDFDIVLRVAPKRNRTQKRRTSHVDVHRGS